MRGPSPRMWGELRDEPRPTGSARTIPTHVGRTTTTAAWSVRRADYPHACGENLQPSNSGAVTLGPSPRMWGEQLRQSSRAKLIRTIPTHVGRTLAKQATMQSLPDHPHACGENPTARRLWNWWNGPSPRMWGELMILPTQIVAQRTIPTHVGRTVTIAPSPASMPDHPHACGENVAPIGCGGLFCGPSPRMWGEPVGFPGEGFWGRTIPTHVGRTRCRPSRSRSTADHPHACGENTGLFDVLGVFEP